MRCIWREVAVKSTRWAAGIRFMLTDSPRDNYEKQGWNQLSKGCCSSNSTPDNSMRWSWLKPTDTPINNEWKCCMAKVPWERDSLPRSRKTANSLGAGHKSWPYRGQEGGQLGGQETGSRFLSQTVLCPAKPEGFLPHLSVESEYSMLLYNPKDSSGAIKGNL